jgi:putative ABC transport system ATP-binding protein
MKESRMSMFESFVEIEALSKSFMQAGMQTGVLHEVSLAFDRGSFSAIVGPSGCGKTTLLGLLGALDTADSGRLVVDGLDLVQASKRELTEYRRSAIGIVFQTYNLLPTLTAVENVEAGLEFLGLKAPARRARALEWLDRVGMAHLANRFPAQLSGGQQQRVAVARVLGRQPKLLLADEPTGNLDEESGERIFQCMKTLQRESNVTCIMVTHDTSLAEQTDRIIRLRDGRVVPDVLEESGELPILRRPESLFGETRLKFAGDWR